MYAPDERPCVHYLAVDLVRHFDDLRDLAMSICRAAAAVATIVSQRASSGKQGLGSLPKELKGDPCMTAATGIIRAAMKSDGEFVVAHGRRAAAIAEALVERGRLTRDEVEDILRQTPTGATAN